LRQFGNSIVNDIISYVDSPFQVAKDLEVHRRWEESGQTAMIEERKKIFQTHTVPKYELDGVEFPESVDREMMM
jgi:hypothetical protein